MMLLVIDVCDRCYGEIFDVVMNDDCDDVSDDDSDSF